MLILVCCFLLISYSPTADGYIIERIFAKVGSCTDCHMNQYLGQIAIKICGSEDCCYTGYLPGSFWQGDTRYFGQCADFDVGEFVDVNGTREMAFMSAAVYHHGIDGIFLERVGVETRDDERFECRMPYGLIDDNTFVQTSDCYWKS